MSGNVNHAMAARGLRGALGTRCARPRMVRWKKTHKKQIPEKDSRRLPAQRGNSRKSTIAPTCRTEYGACVERRGNASPHKPAQMRPEEKYSLLQVGADYWFTGARVDVSSSSDSPASGGVASEGADRLPVLVMYERVRRVLYGHRVERKGADPGHHCQKPHSKTSSGCS